MNKYARFPDQRSPVSFSPCLSNSGDMEPLPHPPKMRLETSHTAPSHHLAPIRPSIALAHHPLPPKRSNGGARSTPLTPSWQLPRLRLDPLRTTTHHPHKAESKAINEE
ncbi:hypothetical protein BDV98DRAFT_574020 [Pterulicium gracile]|uniref:Uncharacterized protein n=1 Tax=Pterulicium gracile TaxID=1884261 RepID=A0A5C3QBY8_9AGAR|nr:hypothetical protein BDV98DRAFT_574020 [Pterula gracilis]